MDQEMPMYRPLYTTYCHNKIVALLYGILGSVSIQVILSMRV